MSLDRTKNKQVTKFSQQKDVETVVNGKHILATQIQDESIQDGSALCTLVSRMHFAVHTYLNLTLENTTSNDVLIGHKVKERNLATRQTHLMTLDKKILELPLHDAFREDLGSESIRNFSKSEGLMISDFDNFMPRNNPIVNFPPPDEY